MRLNLGLLTLLVLVSCGAESRVEQNAPGDPEVVEVSVMADGRLRLNEFGLAIPQGWSYRKKDAGDGWVIAKAIPEVPPGLEPTIVARMVVYPEGETLEGVLEERRAVFSSSGHEVSTAEIAKLPATAFSSDAAYLTYRGESDGQRYQTKWVWIPGNKPGDFLLLANVSFQEESWAELMHGLDVVLRSLYRADQGSELRRE